MTTLGVSVLAVLAVGGVVGLILGVALAPLWERLSYPRVSGVSDAYGSTGIPTSPLDGMDRDRATAIVERWLALSPAPSVRVALVAASPKLDQLAREAAEWLAALTAGATPEFPGRRAVFVAGDSSDPASSPVAEARRSDVVVLLVQSGSRMKDLIDAAGTLGRAGHRPDWSLLVDSVKKTRRTLELARAGDARPARS